MSLESVCKDVRTNCGHNDFLKGVNRRTRWVALTPLSLVIIIVSIMVLVTSCKHQIPGMSGQDGPNNPPATGNCAADTVYFQQQILPVFISNCAMSGCHDNAAHQEGLVLTSYFGIMSAGIRSGNPSESKIYRVITSTRTEDRMPPAPRNPLSSDQISLLNRWISQGAKNNSCVNASCDTANVTYSASIRPVITNKCQGCHSSSSPGGGYDLTTYAGVKARVDDGRLWGAVNYMPGFSAMPKNGIKLSTCELSKLKKWIDAGAPQN